MITSMILTQIALLFYTPKPLMIPIDIADQLLSKSAIVKVKQYRVNPNTHEVQHGMIGCSGTFISSTTVLTAAHCFQNPSTNIWLRDGKDSTSYSATLVKVDADADLALLKVLDMKKPHAYASLGKTAARGQDVFVVGSPFGLEFLLSQGIISKLNVSIPPYSGTYILHTAMTNPGSSGGGIFNTNGELIGVNTLGLGGIFGWVGISGSVDMATIEKFLEPIQKSIIVIRMS